MKNVQKKYQALEVEMNGIFFERTDEVAAIILAHIGMTHVVMLGFPGTGKSFLARKFSEAFPSEVGSTTNAFFEVEMNKFKKPEEIFGPVDMSVWKKDQKLVYRTENYLPNARIAFVDELTRAESVLSTMLTALNERIFVQDGVPVQMPLEMCISATNFKFKGNEFEALRDRFLQWLSPCRLDIENDVQMEAFWSNDDNPKITTQITESELKTVRAEVNQVVISKDTMNVFRLMLIALKEKGIVVSDRRSKAIVRKLVRASAWYASRTETTPEDLACVWTALWEDETQIPLVKTIVNQFANPQADAINKIKEESLIVMQAWKNNPVVNSTEDTSNQLRIARKNLNKIKPDAKNEAEWKKVEFLLERFQESVATILSVKMSNVTI